MMAKPNGGGEGLDFSTWVPCERIPGTQYVVLALVDEGGHGRLYRVRHEITGRVCALKAVHRQYKTVAEFAARLQQEANINTRLSKHPNIAEVLEADITEDGRAYCVMQWLEGANLRHVGKHGAGLDVDRACFVVKSVLAALARAHEFGIVHRDIKPENIFLCDDGLVKLIDFGVAKVFGSTFVQTGQGMRPGTIRYMSPEAIDGRMASPAMDIYSLGLVFWEMLAGEHPFQHANQQDAVHAIVRDGVPPLDERPVAAAKANEALRRAVMRACAGDPAERFPSAEAFDEAIDRAMGYARSRRPLAAGVYPPSYFGEVPVRPAPVAAWAPADAAGRGRAPADAGRGRAPASAHRSSVLERGQGIDSDQLPPPAPWVSQRTGETSDHERRGPQFGVLSHVPPLPQPAPPPEDEDRTPSSTPPLVSGTAKVDAPGAAADADAFDEATALPRGKAPGAGERWWQRRLPLGRVAGRLQVSSEARRAVMTGAGVLLVAVLAFASGRASMPTAERGAAAPARLSTAGDLPTVASAPLSPAARDAAPATSAESALPPAPNVGAAAALSPAPNVSAAAVGRDVAPSPSAANADAPTKRPAASPKRPGATTTLESIPSGAARDLRSRTAPRPPRGPRRLPKGGLEPGF